MAKNIADKTQDELDEAKKSAKKNEGEAENVAPKDGKDSDDEDEEEDLEEASSKKTEGEDEDADGEDEDKDEEKEESVKEDIKIDVTEDVSALLNGEELSEEFQTKATTIFEAAVQRQAGVIQEQLVEAAAVKLKEEVASLQEKQESQIDQFLGYVVEEWMKENQVAVDSGLQTELSEDFIIGLKSLFEEHYIEIPEGKEDVLVAVTEEVASLEEKLNEEITKGIEGKKVLKEAQELLIFTNVSEGLAETQKEKFLTLVEDVQTDSPEEYQTKLTTIKESYFTNAGSKSEDEQPGSISEDLDTAGTNKSLTNDEKSTTKPVTLENKQMQSVMDAITAAMK